ncbi:MAG TPA: hypothetical protein VD993_16255 [Chitinophagaceae bacterium]|nr:hypothetical protein [Chitinophagaceae bacterium]
MKKVKKSTLVNLAAANADAKKFVTRGTGYQDFDAGTGQCVAGNGNCSRPRAV